MLPGTDVHEWSGIRFAKDVPGWVECSCGYVATVDIDAQLHQDDVVSGNATGHDWPDFRRGLKPRGRDGKE